MDCPSCGATAQTKARCEICGFAFPVEGAAASDELSLFLGLVCTACDAYNDPGVVTCSNCGAALDGADTIETPTVPATPTDTVAGPSGPAPVSSSPAASPAAPPSWMTPPSGSPLATAFAMKKVDLSLVGAPAELQAPMATPRPMPTVVPPSSLAAPPSAPPPVARTSAPTPAPGSSPPALSQPVPRVCGRCGAALEANDKFCRHCGARADGGPDVARQAGPAVTQRIAVLQVPPTTAAAAPGATMVLPALTGGAAAPGAAAPSATMFFGAVTAERSAKLILVRGNNQFGSQWRLQAGETVIGRNSGMVLFPDDDALADRHARLVFSGADLLLEPLPSNNGVFLRMRGPAHLSSGDEFVVGAQRLRLVADSDRPVAIQETQEGTKLLGSVVRTTAPPLILLRVAADPRFCEVYMRPQRLLTLGRSHCDINFPNDGFVSERHAQLTNAGSHVLLEDLRSRNGTYLRLTSPTKLAHGDLLLLGDQVLRVELPQAR